MAIEFKPWPKIARLNRDIVITEKIDGTNAAVGIVEFPFGFHVGGVDNEGVSHDVPASAELVLGPNNVDGDGLPDKEYLIYAQSRTRIITPDNDNYGFAKWTHDNAETLIADLGGGLHFGEWWGQGIQRKYGLDHKRFSLFNVAKWWEKEPEFTTPNLGVVPVLARCTFDTYEVQAVLEDLAENGSYAASGFKNPEGIVVFHAASGALFKVTLEGDEGPKSLRKAA